jgi:hypothetical protein
MIKKVLICYFLVFAASVNANTPPYFNEEIDHEYRLLMKHVHNMLPETDLPLAYLPSFYPFSLLDIRPTKLKKEDQQAFSNFNFGVFGGRLLNVNKNQLSKVPSISICKKKKCTEERLEAIKQFLKSSEAELELLNGNTKLHIVQQTAPHVYRINNTFFSPTQLITYFPSKHAGFIPSSEFQLSTPEESPKLMMISSESKSIREAMSKYNVTAIAKINNESTNIIFGGIGDNHWGVVINHNSNIPKSNEYNHIGLEYDIVQKLSGNSFYYQTN